MICIIKAREMGEEVADLSHIIVTGAGNGLPYEVVRGARERFRYTRTIGISPANDAREYFERYGFPLELFTFIVYTGMGLKGRNVVMVRSCDKVLAIGGRIGTLNELTIAFDEGKTIGLLQGSGGISDRFEQLTKELGKPGGKIISDPDPKSLARNVIYNLG